jgi:hypothetical protein
MYTGSGSVGRIVMHAAAEHLTPVILELGGKSPVIVADDANVTRAARRVVWGKYTLNMGQTCVTPDYVLVHRDVKQAFVDAVKAAIAEFYGPDPRACPDVSRLINERHTARVASLLKDDRCSGVLLTCAALPCRCRVSRSRCLSCVELLCFLPTCRHCDRFALSLSHTHTPSHTHSLTSLTHTHSLLTLSPLSHTHTSLSRTLAVVFLLPD